MGLKHLTVWSCYQQFIGLLLARTTRQSSILKQRSVPFTIGANTRKRAFGQITFVKRGTDSKTKSGSNDCSHAGVTNPSTNSFPTTSCLKLSSSPPQLF